MVIQLATVSQEAERVEAAELVQSSPPLLGVGTANDTGSYSRELYK